VNDEGDNVDSKSPKKHVSAQLTAHRKTREARLDAIQMPDGRMRNPNFDATMRQRPGAIEEWMLDPVTGTILHDSIWFCRHVNEILSEDPIRNGFAVEFLSPTGEVVKDDARARAFEQYHEELSARDHFQSSLLDEARYGDGLTLMGIQAKSGGTAEPTQPILPEQVGEILYLVPKPRDGQFKDITFDTDIKSATYGKPTSYKVNIGVSGKLSSGEKDWIDVDASRALHFQTRPRVNSIWGLPIHVPLWTVIQLIANLEWSAGQIAFNMASRVINSDEMVGDIEQRADFAKSFEDEMNTLSALILGKEEKLSTVSNNPGDLNWLVNLTWDIAAAATRINKTRFLGTQAGALASADTDMKRYYEWIKSRQELWLRRPLRHFTAIALSTNSLSTGQSVGRSPVVSTKPRKSDKILKKTGDSFRIVFNPVESPTEKEAVNVQVRQADAIAKRLDAFRSLAMGLQLLADIGIGDPGEILRAVLGTEVTEDTMKKLMESTSGLEPTSAGQQPTAEVVPEDDE
jgi:hypothetical protein